MSILIPLKQSPRQTIASLDSETKHAPIVPIARSVPEAPEKAIRDDEASEFPAGRRREGPEAGEGRAGYYENEFTHGRSQS